MMDDTQRKPVTRLAEQTIDEAIESAYWQFDAMRKGLNEWAGNPKSERDAFKLVCWGLAKGVFPVPSEIINATGQLHTLADRLAAAEERVAQLERLDHRWTRTEINELEQQVAQLREVLSRAMSLGAKICYAEPELSEYRDLREAARQLLTPVPYPGWCRHPDQCQGKSSCPEDPTCAD